MRAARLHELGGTPLLETVEAPSASDRPIRVSASALNPVDIMIGSGRHFSGVPELPYVIGSEAVGTSDDGRRVWVYHRGSMAELVAPGSSWQFEVPEGVSDGIALACGIPGLTGWLAISWRVPVGPDDVVLVLGASGTLGGTVVQGAKLLGARVIGAARRTDRIPAAADEVVSLSEDAPMPAATVIVDGLWGDPFERALAAAKPGVRAVHLGQSAGQVAELRSDWVRGKNATILGHSLARAPEDVARQGYRELCEHARDGRIGYALEAYPLDEVGEAWTRQAAGTPRVKLVVELG
jgi:NADPH:quinone reductase-like Zn-dependent oxidoreductase